jgi:UDP-N-acetylmuramoylalanine--D-glutamate ligase
MNYAGRRATIMGLGHFGGGQAAARWLARQGAVVTVTDLADETTLAAALASLKGEPIAAFHLGGHQEEDFRRADLVVVNPAVRPGNPFLQIAVDCGARLSSEIELFLGACAARLIGVTGSNGKSTTAAMTAAILKAAARPTWLGGNLGGSLLDRLPEITRDHWVVLELSSFQLWHLSPAAPLPQLAVVTGCSPNHLDWHGSYEHYVAAKQRILTGQTGDSLCVLNTFDAEVAGWGPLVKGRQLPLVPLSEIPPLAVRGEHNRINAACAAAAAAGAGCDAAAIRLGLESFGGLPQRLEWFGVVDGRRFYNDSTATTPESTIAALRAMEEPIWLLAGGRSKGFDFAPLCAAAARHARGAAFFGSCAEQLRGRVAAAAPAFPCAAVETLVEALAWCWERSRPGEAILLSPACASTDQFLNFRQRGEKFVELVSALVGRCEG